MTPLLWLIAAVVLLGIEIITPGLFFFACLAVGALTSAFCAWMGMGPWGTWAAFFISSTALILIVAPLARRTMKRMPHTPVGLDRFKGKRAYVLEAVDPTTGKGQVRLENGETWRAMAECPIPAETWAEIIEFCGTRVKVKPTEAPSTE